MAPPPPINPVSSGSTGMNQQFYTPSSSPGNGQVNPLPSAQNNNMAVDPPTYSALGGVQPVDPNLDLYADPDQDPMVTSNGNGGPISVQAQSQTKLSVRVMPSHMGPGGDGKGGFDPNDPISSPSLQYIPNFPGPSSICRLKGCNKPVFVDPSSGHPSDYCSLKHRE